MQTRIIIDCKRLNWACQGKAVFFLYAHNGLVYAGLADRTGRINAVRRGHTDHEALTQLLRDLHYNRLIACSFASETRGLKGHGISEALH